MASSPISSWQIDGKQWKQRLFWGASKSLQMMTAAMKLRHLLLGRKAVTNLDSILKSRDITLPIRVHLLKAMVFPVVMYGCWELDHKEGQVLKNWCFWTVVLDKTLESPLDCKEIKPIHLKGNQTWIFTGRTEAEALVLWPPDAKGSLICETNCQSRFNAWYRMLGAGALGWTRQIYFDLVFKS